MFARDLFGEFRDRFKMGNLNTRQHNSCIPRKLTRPELTANINPHEHDLVSKTQTLIPTNINEFTAFSAFHHLPNTCTYVKANGTILATLLYIFI